MNAIFPAVRLHDSIFKMPPLNTIMHLSRYCFWDGTYQERFINHSTSTLESKATRATKQNNPRKIFTRRGKECAAKPRKIIHRAEQNVR